MENSQSTQNNIILVRKATGDDEPFVVGKLERSLFKAGAETEVIQKIVDDIQKWIYSGVSTHDIYSRAFSLLKSFTSGAASRYSLKQAMMEMGPTGYPFELFMGQLFHAQGYQVEVGIVVDGKSVTHEMDVIATQNNQQLLVECKYHKDQGIHVNVQVPLYVRSRVNDIIAFRQELSQFKDFTFIGWVITNTRFSMDSRQYSQSNGLQLLGWDYPLGNGLKEWIERYKIYPITILHSLSPQEKQILMEKEVVSCSQIKEHPNLLDSLQLNASTLQLIHDELEALNA